MKQQCEFICGAANTVASSVCWTQLEFADSDSREIVAYCVDNLVAIVDVSKSLVTETLRGHKGRINVLKATKTFLISASEDATVRVWSMGNDAVWGECAVLAGVMRSSIIALACIDLASGTLIVASDVSGRVAVWLKGASSHSFTVLQVVDMPAAQMPHDLHLDQLPALGSESSAAGNTLDSPDVLLFIGSVDTRIHIRIASQQGMRSALKSSHEWNDLQSTADYSSTGVFNLVGMLAGHEEWVTCLASVRVDSSTLLLASGSKDSKIRLWRLAFSHRSAAPSATHGSEQEVNFGKFNLNEEDDEDDEGVLDAEGAVLLEPDESSSEARLVFSCSSGTSSGASCRETPASGWSECSVFLEALLVGHEDWVTSVHWMVKDSDETMRVASSTSSDSDVARREESHRLYSTSMDRNMVIWTPEMPSGVWTPTVRVGDIGGQLGGSVGGNLLGFVGGCLSPDFTRMLGVGYGGSFHLWCKSPSSHISSSEQDESNKQEMWAPKSFLSGHFESVNDLVWSPGSNYLVSVSTDQTCRLHAPVLVSSRSIEYDDNSCLNTASTATATTSTNGRSSDGKSSSPWREVSRPQIHGYDLHSIAIAPSSSSYLLYSSADEKLIRIFDAPLCVIEGLHVLCGIDRDNDLGSSKSIPSVGTGDAGNLDGKAAEAASRVRRAYIPELGLSNRAAETMSSQERTEQDARNVQGLDWSHPPLEGQLADYTVWPEVQKLYGHNNGVVCVSLSHCGRWLASASKARDRETAIILLWDTSKYCCVGSLDGHESTVVCLSFSPNDRYLVSSGKDRSLCVNASSPSGAGGAPYSVAAVVPAAHKRIVWTSTWCHDGSLLATGSRDGVCKVWAISDSSPDSSGQSQVQVECLHSFNPFDGVSVTALAFGPAYGPLRRPLGLDPPSWILASGAESGDINFWNLSSSSATLVLSVDSSHCHGSTVKSLAWAPQSVIAQSVSQSVSQSVADCAVSEDSCLRIASCGEDHTVRIFRISL